MSFDPRKNAKNLKRHKLALSFGAEVLNDPNAMEEVDGSMDYGETRWAVMGMVGGVVYVLIYADRTDGPRFISVCEATRRETDRYIQNLG